MLEPIFTMVDGLPKLSDYAYSIPDFRVIIARDRGQKVQGDSDGRKKYFAMKELAYMIWYCHYSSEFVKNYPEGDERHAALIRKLELPNDWKPDSALRKAMETFRDITKLVSRELLEEARESVFAAQGLVRLIGRKMREKIEAVSLDESLADKPEEVDRALKEFQRLQNLISSLPDLVDNINKLEERVKKEEEIGKGKGGKKVSQWQL